MLLGTANQSALFQRSIGSYATLNPQLLVQQAYSISCGQSYKQFTIVTYDCRVVNYDRKLLYKIANGIRTHDLFKYLSNVSQTIMTFCQTRRQAYLSKLKTFNWHSNLGRRSRMAAHLPRDHYHDRKHYLEMSK